MIYLFFYFLINSFLAGMIYEQNISESFWFRFLWSAIFLLFGSVILLIMLIWSVTEELFTTFQLKFFWLYFFTDWFKDTKPERMRVLNNICKNDFNTNSIKHKMYRLTVKMLNKKLNYKP